MAEYIEKQKAINACFDGWNNTPKDCVSNIKAIEPVDVAPVVHGEYIGEYDGYADGNPVCDMWYCSVCGCCFEDWDEKPTYNFCPNCGAKMDGRKRK